MHRAMPLLSWSPLIRLWTEKNDPLKNISYGSPELKASQYPPPSHTTYSLRLCRPRPRLGTLLVPVPTGDEALITMSGSIGSRFSFTHYPQAGMANGPGVTLVRPIPDPSAPFVKFLGMSPRGGGGTGSGSGPGFAFGTLGPILGEVGTSTARVLVEVTWPMVLIDWLVVNVCLACVCVCVCVWRMRVLLP